MGMKYTNRTGEIDPATNKARIFTRMEIADSGYWPNGVARVMAREHEDGSRSFLVAKAQLVDATGRVVR